MASKDSQGASSFNLNEVVTIRGDQYAFGTFNDSIPTSTFVVFKVQPDQSLFPLTADLGIQMSDCDVTDMKTLAEFIERVKSHFLPRLNLWLAKKYPSSGAPTLPSTGNLVVDLGNQVAMMIRVTDGPSGVRATID